MISSHSKVFNDLNQDRGLSDSNILDRESIANFALHQQWSDKKGWKSTLNNFRLIIQPTVFFWMIVYIKELFVSFKELMSKN